MVRLGHRGYSSSTTNSHVGTIRALLRDNNNRTLAGWRAVLADLQEQRLANPKKHALRRRIGAVKQVIRLFERNPGKYLSWQSVPAHVRGRRRRMRRRGWRRTSWTRVTRGRATSRSGAEGGGGGGGEWGMDIGR